ncbi:MULTISPECIES: hypothetical protein [unclassified Nocardioides]|uniref:hypothetical protein n=1 Tax=unclassified Nocardioides TaxID=2615069 RepID=UPI000A532F0A|nr:MULTISPECIES: hypothetical protein [unclassified Nocardioides]
MKRTWVLGLVMGLVGVVFAAMPAQAERIGDEGCTPGYWKNHTDSWSEGPGQPIASTTLLNSNQVKFHTTAALVGDSLLDALNYKGGAGAAGAERNLMRHAAAAWLNAATEDLGYPYRRFTDPYNIVGTVNAAIASGDPAAMLAVKDELAAANELGCPLN